MANRYYLPAISSTDGIELTRVCDVVKERGKEVMERFGAKEYYLDYGEMLQKAGIEAVVFRTTFLANTIWRAGNANDDFRDSR